MTEDEARAAVHAQVGDAAYARLAALATLVLEENRRQNLIAPASEPLIWSRHLLDSTQLLRMAPASWDQWLDVGTGGGFPGLAIAACSVAKVTLVEPRKRRAAFLLDAAAQLELPNVDVAAAKVENVSVPADVISARAVSSVEKLLRGAGHCATTATVWILPRGRSGADDMQKLGRAWKGLFHVEPSVTDPESSIIVARGVTAR